MIDELETKRNPVYYLFSEWLRGGNQDHDRRQLTWGTLITALDEAGLKEEVELLDKYFLSEAVSSE